MLPYRIKRRPRSPRVLVPVLYIAGLVLGTLMVLVLYRRSHATAHREAMQVPVQYDQQRILMMTYVFGEEAANAGYLQMFLQSARLSGIDVAIVGYPKPIFPLPPNVKHVSVTWDQFVDRVSSRLFDGVDLPELRKAVPYKCVDFKPLFAFLFPEQVSEYDWWGHVDNDLVLGDVRHFLTPQMLSQNDVISPMNFHEDKLLSWGPFTVFRNTKVVNELFRQGDLPLKGLLDRMKGVGFDEWGGGQPVDTKHVWNTTMSGILTNHHKQLGIRYFRGIGLPIEWDGLCPDKADQRRCSECTLTWPPHSGLRQRLTKTVDNCTGSKEQCKEEMLLCHYQKGKRNLDASLVDSTVRQHIIEGDGLRVSFLEGFSPLGNSTSLPQ